MAKKQPLKKGEKVLLGVFGAFLGAAVVGYAVLEMVRMSSEEPMFGNLTNFQLSEEGHKGSRIFREARCTACHRAMRNGTNMGLSLDGIGSEHSRDWIYSFLRQPEETYQGTTLDHGMPPKEASYVTTMPEEDLQKIATFLSELTAEQGSSSSPLPPEADSPFIDTMVEMWAPESWKEYPDRRKQEVAQEVVEEGEASQ